MSWSTAATSMVRRGEGVPSVVSGAIISATWGEVNQQVVIAMSAENR